MAILVTAGVVLAGCAGEDVAAVRSRIGALPHSGGDDALSDRPLDPTDFAGGAARSGAFFPAIIARAQAPERPSESADHDRVLDESGA